MTAIEDASAIDPTQTHPGNAHKHPRQLLNTRFSPCGKYVAACGFDGHVQRWDLETGEQHALPGDGGGWLHDLAFQGDRLFAAGSWGSITCWNYDGETPKALWNKADAHPGWIRTLVASADGQWVITAGNDKTIRVWSATDGQPVRELTGHTHPVYSLALHPDGKSLVSGDLSGQVKQWNIETGECARTFNVSPFYVHLHELHDAGGVRSLAISQDGKYLACGGITDYKGSIVYGFPGVLLFDWETGEQKQLLRPQNFETEYKVHGIFVEGLAFHREGFLIGAGGGGERDGAIWFWKPDESVAFAELNKIAGSRSLSIHPDGKRFATAQFTENGRGKNGGNGLHEDRESYHDHAGTVQLYDLTPQPEPTEQSQ